MNLKVIKVRLERFRARWARLPNSNPVLTKEENSKVSRIENVFINAYRNQSLPNTLSPQWHQRLAESIAKEATPKLIPLNEEFLCCRAAWTSLAAALLLASLCSVMFVVGDDLAEFRITEKIVAVGEYGEE